MGNPGGGKPSEAESGRICQQEQWVMAEQGKPGNRLQPNYAIDCKEKLQSIA
jgi:hypothetical protein